ncbi:hypothetical protein AALO_G00238690 [Alosa alosa]|uniref:Uncharacterized protein n=1 Tax=Alosa alosa TaxID=278164 RepID=A0AAV6FZ83_9TELE|nr:hypothetical protein AALO_G00238690 [Alosa alosa]
MYIIPELFGTEDYLCPVAEEDLVRCEDSCTHRRDIACDDDLFTLCTYIMAQKKRIRGGTTVRQPEVCPAREAYEGPQSQVNPCVKDSRGG